MEIVWDPTIKMGNGWQYLWRMGIFLGINFSIQQKAHNKKKISSGWKSSERFQSVNNPGDSFDYKNSIVKRKGSKNKKKKGDCRNAHQERGRDVTGPRVQTQVIDLNGASTKE